MAVTTFFGVIGCSNQARAEEISVTLWGTFLYGAPFAVAIENGYFKEEGVDITGVLSSKGGGTTVRNILAGGLPYGEVSLAAAVHAANEGIAIKIVNSGVPTTADMLWVTMPDSPLKGIADLAGKKIAYTTPKSVTDMLAIMVLDSKGLSGSVERVSLGGVGPALTALEQGFVAAAPIWEPLWSARSGRYKPLFYVKDLLLPVQQSVGIVTTEFALSKPGIVKAIVVGRARGVDFIYAHPKEAAAIVARQYNADPGQIESAILALVRINYWSRGEFNYEAMDRLVAGMRIVGDLHGKVDWTALVDASFLPAATETK